MIAILLAMGVVALVAGFILIVWKIRVGTGIAIFFTGIGVLIIASVMTSQDDASNCERAGGAWTSLGRDSVCLSPDGRIINRG